MSGLPGSSRRPSENRNPWECRRLRTSFSTLVFADGTLRIRFRVAASVVANTRLVGAETTFTERDSDSPRLGSPAQGDRQSPSWNLVFRLLPPARSVNLCWRTTLKKT